jgi:hypothetical protein
MSERRACRVIGCCRTTVRHEAVRQDDPVLRERLKELARVRRRFGYRRLHVFLRREGHSRSALAIVLEPMANNGSIHIDIAEAQTAEGKLCLFVGIDRTAKFAVAQLVATADKKTAGEFFQHMPEAMPYQIHTVLPDNGIQFAEQPRNRNTIYSRPMRFDMICEGEPLSAIGPRTMASGIEHRLTKPNHPWSHEDQKTIRGIVFLNGGQVERMNRTIKEATVKRFQCDSHDQLGCTSPTSPQHTTSPEG